MWTLFATKYSEKQYFLAQFVNVDFIRNYLFDKEMELGSNGLEKNRIRK